MLYAPSTDDTACAQGPHGHPALDLDGLYRAHGRHVKAFVSRLVRNPADAEDIVQMTFLEAARCAADFVGRSKPSTWLFGIAHNLARNHVRSACRRPEHVDVSDWSDSVPDECADPARLIECRDLLRKALASVDRMSTELQKTFYAVLDEGLSYDDAARGLQVPVGTVRSRLSSIRVDLRQLGSAAA